MMTKQKLLIVTEALEMNGVLRSLLDFMEAMDKTRYDISLFCFDAYQPSFVKLPPYVKLLPEKPECYMARAPFARIFGWALHHGAFWMLARRLLCSVLQNRSHKFSKQSLAVNVRPLREEYDVAIAYSMGMTWRFVAEKVTAKRRLMWLDTDPRFDCWIGYWENYAKFLRNADALICVSEAIRDVVRKEFAGCARRIETIHNTVNSNGIVKKGAEPLTLPRSNRFRIVTVGRFCYPKNQSMIPAIAGQIKHLGIQEFEWIMIGTLAHDFEQAAQDEIRRLGLKDNLIYLDGMPNPLPIVKSADLYVQPSVYEGWGLTLSEAMCLGKYVIASDIPAFREQVKTKEEGILVECTPEAFAGAIVDFMRSPIKVSETPSMCERFDFIVVRKELESVLKKCDES